MSVFAIMSDRPNPELGERVKELFPRDYYQLSDAGWLVVAETAATPLAEQLDIRQGRFGRVLVIQTRGTGAGWHGKAVWEWLRAKVA